MIGGGATGAGVAFDAAIRGLRVAVIERDNFESGISSKSTKSSIRAFDTLRRLSRSLTTISTSSSARLCAKEATS